MEYLFVYGDRPHRGRPPRRNMAEPGINLICIIISLHERPEIDNNGRVNNKMAAEVETSAPTA